MLISKKNKKEQFNEFIKYCKNRYDQLNEKNENTFPRYIISIYFDDIDVEESLRGLGSNDEGIDAFIVNDDEKKVYFIQFKSRNNFDEKEKKDAKKEWFSMLDSSTLHLTNNSFKSRNKRINEIFELLRDGYAKNYDIKKQIYHMGYCSDDIINNNKGIEYIGMEEILEKFVSLYEEDEDESPDSVQIEINIEQNEDYNTINNLVYFTPKTNDRWKRRTLVFPICGDQIIKLLEQGSTILDRNVRGFLGDKNKVNGEMIKTAINMPEMFYFYNNGISITCDDFKISGLSNNSNKKLELKKPQVINGAQTVNCLKVVYDKKKSNEKKYGDALNYMKKIYVMCKIVTSTKGEDRDFAKNLTTYNNMQNKIKTTDFYSNEKEQRMLKEGLARYNIEYIIKRGKLINEDKEPSKFSYKTKIEDMAELIYGKNNLDFKTSIIFREDTLKNQEIYNEIFGEGGTPDVDKVIDFAEIFFISYFLNQNIQYIKSVFNEIDNIRNKSEDIKDKFITENRRFGALMKNGRLLNNLINDEDYNTGDIEKYFFLMDKKYLLFIFWKIYTSFSIQDEYDNEEKIQNDFKKSLKKNNEEKIKNYIDALTPHAIRIYSNSIKKMFSGKDGFIKSRHPKDRIAKNIIDENIDEYLSEYNTIKKSL